MAANGRATGLKKLFPPNLERDYFAGPESSRFEPDAAGFELANAWWLAEASLLAYLEEEEALPRFRNGAGLEAELIDREGTQVYVASGETVILVAFRGTQFVKPGEPALSLRLLPEIVQDFYANLGFDLIPWEGGGSVHGGFAKALDAVWPELEERLLTAGAIGDDRPVWLAGHSLGGALATLAASRIKRNGGKPTVYTIGSPLVGDAGFALRFDVPAYRLVNNNDVVPRIPPFGRRRSSGFLPARYRHVGSLRYLTRRGRVVANPGPLARNLDGILGRARHFSSFWRHLRSDWLVQLPVDRFQDHAPVLYADLLRDALARGRP